MCLLCFILDPIRTADFPLESCRMLQPVRAFSFGSVIACDCFISTHGGNTAFLSSFPIAESLVKAFCRLFLWGFKEKSINHFLWHSLPFLWGTADSVPVHLRPAAFYRNRLRRNGVNRYPRWIEKSSKAMWYIIRGNVFRFSELSFSHPFPRWKNKKLCHRKWWMLYF